jgi:1-phosphofructokinase family hexose kinase
MIYTLTLNPGLDRTISVPEIRFDEVLRASDARADVGGKGFNVSSAIRALGGQSIALGFVGGATGQCLTQGLAALGIETDFVPIQGETRTNTVILESSSGRYIKVNEAGATIRPEEQTALLKKVTARARAGDYWVFSGALPPGLPPDFYTTLINMVQRKGSRAVLDASGEAFRLGCVAQPYLIKPNEVEAEQVSGITVRTIQDARRAAAYFLALGMQVVALSRGAQGLLLSWKGGNAQANAPKVLLKNTVGAGDALLGGLVWALEGGKSLEDAARWGVACGSAAAALEGTNFATLAEVEKLM